MSDPVKELDKREWRLLGVALAVLLALAGFVVLMESRVLPESLLKPVALVGGVVFLGVLAVLRTKSLGTQVERGRIDPMTRGERGVAALLALSAFGGLAAIHRLVDGSTVRATAYAGLVVTLLVGYGLLDLWHRRHRNVR